MKLSIILTVYNKEKYLRRAMETILNQDDIANGEYEVLAVNDGSTDKSASILDDFSERDPRLRILTQNNQGLSLARNNGVKAALGEYVWFVDADDTISPKAVSLICGAINDHPDIIPIYAKTEGLDKIRNEIPKEAKSGRDILLSYKWEACGVFNVFKKSFLLNNNLSFYPGIYHEDVEFTPRVLYLAKTAVVIPEVLYTVYKTEGSITDIPKVKRAYDCLFVAESNNRIIEENEERGSELGRVLCARVSNTITNSLNIMRRIDKKEWEKFNNELWSKRYLFDSMEQSGVFRYWLLAKLVRLFPKKYVQVFTLFK